MKKIFLSIAFIGLALNYSFGQSVTIGEKEFTPQPGAILEIQSASKGIIIPRVTYAQRMHIPVTSASLGLFVYQTDKDPGFYYYDGAEWKNLAPVINIDGGSIDQLAKVAVTGKYEDLIGEKPVKLSDLTEDEKALYVSKEEKEKWTANYVANTFTGKYDDLTGKPTLAKVATSGNYIDLVDKPSIPINLRDLSQDELYAMYVTKAEKEKWNTTYTAMTFSGNYNDLINKPTFAEVATTGLYKDLKEVPAFAQVAATGELRDIKQDELYAMYVTKAEKDKWNALSNFDGSYNSLSNKPELKAVATTASYDDLKDKPKIPSSLRDLDQDDWYAMYVTRAEKERWNAIATINNFSGSYLDLTNKPTIPTKLSQLLAEPEDCCRVVSVQQLADIAMIPKSLRDLATIGTQYDDYKTVSREQILKWDAASDKATNIAWEDVKNRPEVMVKSVATLEDLAEGTNTSLRKFFTFADKQNLDYLAENAATKALANNDLAGLLSSNDFRKIAGLDDSYAKKTHIHTSVTDIPPHANLSGELIGIANSDNYGHVKISDYEYNALKNNNGALSVDMGQPNQPVGEGTIKQSGATLGASATLARADHQHSATFSDVGAAPKSHASTSSEYGIASSDNYGHVKISSSGGITNQSGEIAIVPADGGGIAIGYEDNKLSVNMIDILAVANTSPPAYLPLAPGDASVGSTLKAARADHVHPTQTTIANFSGFTPSTLGNLKPGDATLGLEIANLNDIYLIMTKYIDLFIPVGTVIMYSIDDDNVPCGWEKYSEMEGRFPVGVGTPEEGGTAMKINKNGGSQEVTLTIDQMPRHNHTFGTAAGWSQSGDAGYHDNNTPGAKATNFSGGGLPHNNLPPYRGIRFLRRISESCPRTNN